MHLRPGCRCLPLCLLLLAATGCGPAPPEPAAPSRIRAPQPPAPPRDAAARARQLVGARLDVLIFAERLRHHPLAPRLASLGLFSPLLEATGIDPLADLDRAFVAAKSASDQQSAIAVLEHHLEPARLRHAIDALIEQSGEQGGRLKHYPVPAARVVVRSRTSVLLVVGPALLVVTSEALAPRAAAAFAGTGGLPEPAGLAAMVAHSEQPSASLELRRLPPIPDTIRRARAEVTPEGDGALLDIDAESTSAEQARLDARLLNRRFEEASTVKIAVVRIRMFEPIVFVADGSHVEAHRVLDRGELEQLFALAELLDRRASHH